MNWIASATELVVPVADQIGDETLHFGGGRLLLRGVNGSGKSTAMNMLLPFLIDADTRRIDAAGEQAAVHRSWMLSGRDEQQPVGYLWIEFARTDEATDEQQFLVCGCGAEGDAKHRSRHDGFGNYVPFCAASQSYPLAAPTGIR